MADNVVYLHGKPKEIAQATRLGFREHGQCEQLSAKRLELAYEAPSGLHDRTGNIEFPAEAKFRIGSRQTEMF